MGLFDSFRRKPAADAAMDSKTVENRLRIVPDTTPREPGRNLGTELHARNAEQGRERQAIEIAMQQFLIDLVKVERPDQYLTTLSAVLEQQKASPAVVREMVKRCKAELGDFYRSHAGGTAILKSYERPPQPRGVEAEHTAHTLVPKKFASRSQLDLVRVLFTQIDEWGEQWIAHQSEAPAPDQMAANG